MTVLLPDITGQNTEEAFDFGPVEKMLMRTFCEIRRQLELGHSPNDCFADALLWGICEQPSSCAFTLLGSEGSPCCKLLHDSLEAIADEVSEPRCHTFIEETLRPTLRTLSFVEAGGINRINEELAKQLGHLQRSQAEERSRSRPMELIRGILRTGILAFPHAINSVEVTVRIEPIDRTLPKMGEKRRQPTQKLPPELVALTQYAGRTRGDLYSLYLPLPFDYPANGRDDTHVYPGTHLHIVESDTGLDLAITINEQGDSVRAGIENFESIRFSPKAQFTPYLDINGEPCGYRHGPVGHYLRFRGFRPLSSFRMMRPADVSEQEWESEHANFGVPPTDAGGMVWDEVLTKRGWFGKHVPQLRRGLLAERVSEAHGPTYRLFDVWGAELIEGSHPRKALELMRDVRTNHKRVRDAHVIRHIDTKVIPYLFQVPVFVAR